MFTSVKPSALSAAFLLLALDGLFKPVGARASPHAAAHDGELPEGWSYFPGYGPTPSPSASSSSQKPEGDRAKANSTPRRGSTVAHAPSYDSNPGDTVAAAAANAPSTGSSSQYTLVDDYFDKSPSHFFDKFDFFDQTSPTSGFVKYLDRGLAEKSTLIGFVPPQIVQQNNVEAAAYGANPGDNKNAGGTSTNNANLFSVYAGIDKQTASVTNGGRQSVRISSKKSYNPGTLVIAEIAHMPSGCGTWPAFWMLGGPQEWPASGEIDIVEQVNSCARNSVTLHTGPGCAIEGGGKNSSGVDYAGNLVTRNCDVNDPNQDKNEGCSIADSGKNTAAPSFGEGFNKAKGGTYITEWTTSGITVWFYGASDPEASKTLGAIRASKNPDPSTFGKPMAKFAGGGCDWGKEFENLKIIINTELCGQWAGRAEAWESSGCKKKTGAETCQQWVQSAKGLEEAYWVFDGLRVYEKK